LFKNFIIYNLLIVVIKYYFIFYLGVGCEVNIDECQLYSACKNGATCSDLVNGYACLCAPGYAGKYYICLSVRPRLCR